MLIKNITKPAGACSFPVSETWAYLAGLIDGEGTVTITHHRQHGREKFQYKPFVYVTNTDLPLIEFLQKTFGGSITKNNKKKSPRHKPCHAWRVMSLDGIRIVLENTMPYLVIKKERALLLLRFISLRQGAQVKGGHYKSYGIEEGIIHEKIKVMNQAGVGNELLRLRSVEADGESRSAHNVLLPSVPPVN